MSCRGTLACGRPVCWGWGAYNIHTRRGMWGWAWVGLAEWSRFCLGGVMICRSGVLLILACFWTGLGRFGGPALPSLVYSCVGRHHMHHSSSCLQAEQSIMSSSDNKSSSSSEQTPSSKEQQTSLSESEYVGVVRHPLSTYYVHKDILNIPDCKTPDFEAAPSRVHSLTTLAYLAWVGWPRPKDPGSDNPNQTTCSCGCTTNGRPHMRMRQD